MWLDALALLPLIALGVHYCVAKGKFTLYTVSLAIAMFSSFYMGFMLCIFSVLFFFVQYFSNYNLNATLPEKSDTLPKLQRLRLPRAALAFGMGSVLAGGLAAIALLPTFFALQSSSATSATMPENANLFFNAFDFLAQHFASLSPTIRGHGMNAMPNVYSGVIALLLAPLFLLAPKIKLREKIAYSALMVFMFLSMNVNILNWLWHAGQASFPTTSPTVFRLSIASCCCSSHFVPSSTFAMSPPKRCWAWAQQQPLL
jgi:uncharacterized membrane protein YfhO